MTPSLSAPLTRRTTLTAFAAGGLTLALASCSTAAGGGGGSTTGSISTIGLYASNSPTGKWLTALTKAFEKANKGITVSHEMVTQTQVPTNFGKAVISGTEPDLVLINRAGAPVEYYKQGATVAVEGYLKKWGLAQTFTEVAIQQWTDDEGHLEAFPLEGYNWPMWYNVDLLKKAGVDTIPNTVDGLLSAAKSLRAAGIQPWVVGAADYPSAGVVTLVGVAAIGPERLQALYKSGDWSGSDGQTVVQLVTRLRDGGLFSDDSAGLKYADQVARFGAGKAAILFDGSWGYGNAASSFPKLNITLGGFPVQPDSGLTKPVAFSGQSTGIWISKNGVKHIDAVEKFIKAIYTPKNLGAFVELGYISPVREGKADIDDSKLPPLQVASQKSLAADTTLVTPSYNDLSASKQSAFGRAAAQAFVKGTSAAALTKSMNQAWQAK